MNKLSVLLTCCGAYDALVVKDQLINKLMFTVCKLTVVVDDNKKSVLRHRNLLCMVRYTECRVFVLVLNRDYSHMWVFSLFVCYDGVPVLHSWRCYRWLKQSCSHSVVVCLAAYSWWSSCLLPLSTIPSDIRRMEIWLLWSCFDSSVTVVLTVGYTSVRPELSGSIFYMTVFVKSHRQAERKKNKTKTKSLL